MDTYKYIEVKKSVFLKYKAEIVQLHSIITKQETQHNIQVVFFSFLFFFVCLVPQTLYNTVHWKKQRDRNRTCCWFPPRGVAAVNITNEEKKKGTVFVWRVSKIRRLLTQSVLSENPFHPPHQRFFTVLSLSPLKSGGRNESGERDKTNDKPSGFYTLAQSTKRLNVMW